MNVLIRTIDSTTEIQSLMLRTGQRATVGKSANADLAFPRDASMGDPHVEFIAHRSACYVKSLCKREFLVNDEPVLEATLHPKDVVTIGQTRLQVDFDGEPLAPPAPDAIENDTPPAKINLLPVCDGLKLASAASLAASQTSLAGLIDQLEELKDYEAAIPLRAYQLGPPLAVRWVCTCIHEHAKPLHGEQAHALTAAETWSHEPSEENRRSAEKAAAAADHSGLGGFVAWAAFCSGDNVGPAEYEQPVPPEPHVECIFLRAALVLLAYEHADPNQQFQVFLDIGRNLADDANNAQALRTA